MENKSSLCTGNNPNTAQKALSHYFEISIEDDGIGINETELERIFDRFIKYETAKTTQTSEQESDYTSPAHW